MGPVVWQTWLAFLCANWQPLPKEHLPVCRKFRQLFAGPRWPVPLRVLVLGGGPQSTSPVYVLLVIGFSAWACEPTLPGTRGVLPLPDP
eukprot:15523232-Heterocapsa_arctica.AAC.1